MRLELTSADGAFLIPFAKQQLAILDDQRRSLHLTRLEKTLVVGAFIVTITATGEGDTIRIIGDESVSGVICRPRSGSFTTMKYTEYVVDPLGSHPESRSATGVPGGWKSGTTELATQYLFPLVDEDNAAFVVGMEDGQMAGQFADGGYGNLYWTNGQPAETLEVLSWKGTPTRHFWLPSNLDIPGLTLFETATPALGGDIPQYTAFGTKLYEGGNVFADAPLYSWPYNPSGIGGRCLILGAMRDTAGGTYIVTQSDHYSAPENVFVFSNGYRLDGTQGDKNSYLAAHAGVAVVFERPVTKTGLYLTLWKSGGSVDGWSLVSELNYGRNGLPWFGNSSGTEFVCSNGDRLTAAGVLTLHTGGTGSYQETATLIGSDTYNAAVMSFAAKYSGNALTEFVGDTLTSSAVSAAFTAASAVQSTASVSKTYEGVFPTVYSEATPIVVSGPDTWANNPGDYTATGGDPPYYWSYPSGCGGTGTVTASTLGCPSGPSGSKTVTMPPGVWVLNHLDTRACNVITDTTISVYPTKTTRIDYIGQRRCNCTIGTYFPPGTMQCLCGAYDTTCFVSLPGWTDYPCIGVSEGCAFGQPFNGTWMMYVYQIAYYALVCP